MTSKKLIRDHGYVIGELPIGERNSITDVDGVTVGQTTVISEKHHTGVTVILPAQDNVYLNKVTAASYVLNGFGKTAGLVQVDELGAIETPIALTNTLCVGKVWDALVTYTIAQCEKDGLHVTTIDPVVGETNDSQINDIQDRAVGEKEVLEAIANASKDVEQGCVGAGAGTTCCGLKGGIGTSSRRVRIGRETYTVGALVQSNFGATRHLSIGGELIGPEIAKKVKEAENDKGSIMMVLATDAPLSDRQLKRLLKRAAVGLVHTGSYMGHGSGDVMIGFTTANRIPHQSFDIVEDRKVLRENLLDSLFQGAAESVEEAILNSLAAAEPVRALDGRMFHALSEFLELKGN